MPAPRSIAVTTGRLYAAEAIPYARWRLHYLLIHLVVSSYFEQLNPGLLLTFDLNKVKDDPQVVSDTAGPETSELAFQFVSF